MARALLGCLSFLLVAAVVGLTVAGAFTGRWVDSPFYKDIGLYRFCRTGIALDGDCQWAHEEDSMGQLDWWIATEALVGVGILITFFSLLCSPCWFCKKSSGFGKAIAMDVLLGTALIAAGLILFYIKFDDNSALQVLGAKVDWGYWMAWGGVACGVVACILGFCMSRSSQ